MRAGFMKAPGGLVRSAVVWRRPSRRADRAPGSAGPVAGLLGGKDPTGRFCPLSLLSSLASEKSFRLSTPALSIVVQDRADAAVLREQRIAAVAEQVQVEGLIGPFVLGVALDVDR